MSDQEYLFLMNYYSSKNMEYLFSEMRSIRDEVRGLRELMDKKYSGVIELIDKKYAEVIAYADKSKKESMEYTDRAKKEIIDYVDKRFNDLEKRTDDMRDIFVNYFNQIITLLSKK